MRTKDYKRPTTLYHYSKETTLLRALTLGEFQVTPMLDPRVKQKVHPVGMPLNSTVTPHFLTLGFAQIWDEHLFNKYADSDACLVIHNTEEFGERLHYAVQRALPNWAGIDGAMSYGQHSPLGGVFTKPITAVKEQEWQFAWRPTQPTMAPCSLTVKLGSLEAFAEIRKKDYVGGS